MRGDFFEVRQVIVKATHETKAAKIYRKCDLEIFKEETKEEQHARKKMEQASIKNGIYIDHQEEDRKKQEPGRALV